MGSSDADDRRVQFDFEIDFLNGGGIQGQAFRLDIDGEDIDDDALAAHIVRDLRLLMVGEVRIRNKVVIHERHKRTSTPSSDIDSADDPVHIDLSHTVEEGMATYPGLPGPIICDFLSREQSRSLYAPGTEFQIGQINMCSNTGTYVDSPFHRYEDGMDLAEVPLGNLADLDAVTIDVTGSTSRAIRRMELLPYDVHNKAVLIRTGWDRLWRTDAYFDGHPYLSDDAARYLVDSGVLLVGIDSLNIDDTNDFNRPAHSILLRAGIPICEHLTRLSALPADGFRFSAVPVKVRGMGTFPVRAYATLIGSKGA